MSNKIPHAGNNWSDGTEHSARQEKHGRMIIEMLPEGYILLHKEIATGYHPKLEESLAEVAPGELEEKLLRCALYVGIVVDGFYTIQEKSVLAATIAGRLEMLRDLTAGKPTQVILGFDSGDAAS